MDYLFHKDKNVGKGPSLVMLMWNGIDYYCPALPREIVQLTCSATRATTHLTDAIKLLDHVLNNIPGSNASDAISKALRYVWAGKCHLEQAHLTTGAASMAPKEIDVPVPRSLLADDVAKMAHKRVASSRVIPVPEKCAKESESDFKQWKKAYEKEVTLLAAWSTCLEKNQCPVVKCSTMTMNWKHIWQLRTWTQKHGSVRNVRKPSDLKENYGSMFAII